MEENVKNARQFYRNRSFKAESIFVTRNDLNVCADQHYKHDVYSPKLLPNLLNQSYDNSAQYLDTHFYLLREELCCPLRQSVQHFKSSVNEFFANNNSNNNYNHNRHRNGNDNINAFIENISDYNVYTDIQLESVEVDKSVGVVVKVSFNGEPLKEVDWSESSRLLSGSLLCLSSDYFNQSIIFALVVDTYIVSSKNEFHMRIEVDIDNDSCEQLFHLIRYPSKKYIAIESKAYFEGMRHTLSKLQQMDDTFPFKQFIVDNNISDIKAPPYLDDETKYNFSSIALKEKNNDLLSMPILNCDKYSLIKASSLDCKQFEAFFAALTKEFTIIQGPPGTGKTFVALKIVKCLLDNRDVWADSDYSCPILIVCYKNHALDQFLEGILKFCDQVIRIGGKSESKLLEDYLLKTIRRNDIKGKELPEFVKNIFTTNEYMMKRRKFGKFLRRIEQLCEELNSVFDNIRHSFNHILGDHLKPYIEKRYLLRIEAQKSKKDFNECFESWLSSGAEALDKCKLANENNGEWAEELDSINLTEQNIWSIETKLKWKLYYYWREKFFTDSKKRIKELSKTLKEEIFKLKNKQRKVDAFICSRARVIGVTITGASKHRALIESLNPKIMIVEEAAEVVEGHLVAAIASQVQHLILIGDHQQLRPITNVHELSKDYNLDISLFERMIMNELKHYQLTLQHRMSPCISELLKVANIYKDLRDDASVKQYPKIKILNNKNLFFLNHSAFEDNNNTREVKDKSRSNLHEANFILELIHYFLLRKIDAKRITVLTTYNAQLRLIKRLMFERKEIFAKLKEVVIPNPSEESDEESNDSNDDKKYDLLVRVSSVDGYQGEENDIIIISFVRSSKHNNIGFLDVKNRVCVALSRAKHAMYCIGNFEVMATRSKMWKNLVQHLKQKEEFGDEIVVGCDCNPKQPPKHITMPRQFLLNNHVILNKPECECNRN